ncbi:uncharacterized protein LOC116221402 [Clupea harengus]|uniref:Uncharacterized protein LOC116221402 n=1 Tax=Clupea harengus TaxID=7950 RepID=A0A6P8FLS0_CLUHA|nr:uncharacterized protein LOC116221402 [Clupea harengus]
MEQTPHSFLISYQTEGTEPETISTEAQSTVMTELKPYTEYTSIKPGIPACYLLSTEKSDVAGNSAVRRWTFGERDKSRTTKTILLIGETGTGKTTLINTMVNYILGVEWEDRVWFQIAEENKGRKSQVESRTSDITVYEVFVETSDSCLRIIDTPGYGATDWMNLDQMTADNLRFLFTSEDGIHEIDAVGLVVKSTQNRLTQFHQYIFDTILSVFGKDIKNNIAVFITHSDGLPAANVITSLNEAGVPCAKDTGGEPLHFMFNNRQTETYEEAHEGAYHAAWNLGRDSVKRFLGFMEDTDRKSLQDCTELSEVSDTERRRLEACVSNLKDAIITEKMRQEMHLQTHKALETFKRKLDNNEHFCYEVEVPHKVEVPIKSLLQWTTGAMCCTICQENCHYPGCGLVKDRSACTVMKNNRCTVCTGKCPASAHVKQRKIFKQEIKSVVKKSKDLKQQYGEEVDVKKAVEKELNKSKANMSDLLGKAYRCLAKLTNTDSKRDSMSILLHLKFFIEKVKEMGDDDSAQKFEELQRQMMPLNRKGSRLHSA